VEVFIGAEALASGRVTRHELGAAYERILPGVYAPKRMQLAIDDHIVAAWLWSKRRGVIAGAAASALHGARWVGPDVPVELNVANNKAPVGIVARNDTLLEAELTIVGGLTVTTVERTAFDLARRGPVGRAVERLDALARATHFKTSDILGLAANHPRLRGLLRVPEVLDLVDAGAQSPKETWLRLLLIAAGFPPPQTQIPVLAPDGYPRYFLDMGWEEFMVAAEYDGQQHRTDPVQYRGDVTRSEYIAHKGWRRIAVLAGDRGPDIIRRVEQAGVPRMALR
jgi:hypothetical protein